MEMAKGLEVAGRFAVRFISFRDGTLVLQELNYVV